METPQTNQEKWKSSSPPKRYNSKLNSRGEDRLTKTIENQTTKLPSDVFLFAGIAAIACAAGLKAFGRSKDAQFVGQWVPTFLLFGLYNKIVKIFGSEPSKGH